MTRDQWGVCLEYLDGFFFMFDGFPLEPEIADRWHRMLNDFPVVWVIEAIRHWAETVHAPPTPGELREIMVSWAETSKGGAT